jgi:hypothetical protein
MCSDACLIRKSCRILFNIYNVNYRVRVTTRLPTFRAEDIVAEQLCDNLKLLRSVYSMRLEP